MTVSTTDNRIPYSGNGVTTVFDFPYKFLSASNLKVYVDDVLMTLTTDYSVGTPSDDGALVTFVVAPPSGTNNIVILRDPDLLQQSALPSNGPFPSVTVETMVDKAMLVIQRLSELVGRSFRLPDSDTSGASTTLPTPTANNIIGWNSGANGLANYTVSDFATILVAGNYTLDTFSGDGVTTSFELTNDPASINNTQVNVGGVYQLKSDYSIADNILTFDTAPPVGVNNVEVVTGGALPAQEPTDGSVTLAKMPNGVFAATAGALAKFADGFFSTSALSKFVDGFLTADATGRAKMADGFVTLAKTTGVAGSGANSNITSMSALTAITTPGGIDIKGTNTNDSAAAGDVGEYIESIVLLGSAVPLTTSVIANITSISLTAGDWEVGGNVVFLPASTTSITTVTAAVNSVSATLPTLEQRLFTLNEPATVHGASVGFGGSTRRFSLSATTTIYLVATSIFTVSTMTAYGRIFARRVR